MRLPYEETHKKKTQDDKEKAAWKRAYKTRVQEANEKSNNGYAYYFRGLEARSCYQISSSG